jgi:hypothetical protein
VAAEHTTDRHFPKERDDRRIHLGSDATADQYAERGWPVFPVRRDKTPMTPHGFKDATTDRGQIREWWTAWPDANVGLRTGVSFDVLDLDSPEAYSEFQAECEEHGFDLRSVPHVETGRGHHFYFAPAGLRRRPGFREHWDWLGVGGYVVAPPSVHESGAIYTWAVQVNGSLPRVPPWFLAVLRPAQLHPEECQECPHLEAPGPAYFAKVVENVRTANEGKRNDQLNGAIYTFATWAKEAQLDEDEWVEKIAHAAWRSGLDRDEIRATVRSAWQAGVKTPHRVGKATVDDLHLPEAFYDRRNWLKTVRQAAYSRGTSADALLHAVMQRYLCLVDSRFTLPGTVGADHASLNLQVVLLGQVGGGKGVAVGIAEELLPQDVHSVPLGSGEGIAQAFFAYVPEKNAKVWRRCRSAVLVDVREGQALEKLAQRTGQTTEETLRSAYSGETLGGTYRSNPCRVEKGTYRLSLIIGIQPEMAAYLFSDLDR